jgi:hypothetical protein
MRKYFPDWDQWDEQVPIYDIRGLDPGTVRTVGIMFFTRVMPRADILAVKPDRLLLVEFDKQMMLTHVGHLDRYIDAIRNDAIRPKWHDIPIEAAYVTPGYDARIEAECTRKGYRYIVEEEPAP